MNSPLASLNEVSSKDDLHRLQHALEEQRRSLVNNSNFHVLKVEHGKERIDERRWKIESLRVVTPACDPDIAKAVTQKGWICISHLRGNPADWIVWNDSGVVDDKTGVVIKPTVHPDRCEEIMALLQEYDGYWWIDIFCSQSDTPLVIMGNIYKHCNRCFVINDVPYELYYGKLRNAYRNAADLTRNNLTEATNEYLSRVSRTHHEKDRSTEWVQILSDLMYWSSSQLEKTADQSIKRWKKDYPQGPRADQFFDALLGLPIDKKIETAQKFFDSKEHNPSDFCQFSESRFMEELQGFRPETLVMSLKLLAQVLNCQWLNRVWTLQELALSEIMSVPHGRESGSAGLMIWQKSFADFLTIIMNAYKIRATATTDRLLRRKQSKVLQTPQQLLEDHQRTDPILARIYNDYRRVLEVALVIDYNGILRNLNESDVDFTQAILNSFATSQRMALCPVDYVYGVLGILNIDMPRLEDPTEVWRVFSKKLQKRFPSIHVPDNVDLTKTTKMEDVYGQLGFTTEDNIPSIYFWVR